MTTIDLTDRYFDARYMNGGTQRWVIDRDKEPFEFIVLHHIAGWYGAPLGVNATRAQEEAQIQSLAADHAGRSGDWVGPGYNACVFPSGRVYAVGKAGTERRHTGGHYNRSAYAIVAFGNYTTEIPTAQMLAGITEHIGEVLSWTHLIKPDIKIIGHRDAWGTTTCPGNNLYPFVKSWQQLPPPVKGEDTPAKPPLPLPQEIDMSPEQVRQIVREMPIMEMVRLASDGLVGRPTQAQADEHKGADAARMALLSEVRDKGGVWPWAENLNRAIGTERAAIKELAAIVGELGGDPAKQRRVAELLRELADLSEG